MQHTLKQSMIAVAVMTAMEVKGTAGRLMGQRRWLTVERHRRARKQAPRPGSPGSSSCRGRLRPSRGEPEAAEMFGVRVMTMILTLLGGIQTPAGVRELQFRVLRKPAERAVEPIPGALLLHACVNPPHPLSSPRRGDDDRPQQQQEPSEDDRCGSPRRSC